MDRGCGAPRLLVLRRAPIRARPVAGRAPLVLLLFFGGGGVDYRCSTDGLVTDQWTGWMAGWWSPFFLPRFSCPDEGHVGGWVEGIREEARVKGMVVVVVVVVEQGGVCV